MSFFSGKTITSVQVGTSRIFEKLPKRKQQAVASALISGDNIVTALMAMGTQGGLFALRKMLRYSQGSNYSYGTPTITLGDADVNTPYALLSILKSFNDIDQPIQPADPQGQYYHLNKEYEIIDYDNTQYPSANSQISQADIVDRAWHYQAYQYYLQAAPFDGDAITLGGQAMTITFGLNEAHIHLDGTYYEDVPIIATPAKAELFHMASYRVKYTMERWSADDDPYNLNIDTYSLVESVVSYSTKKYFGYDEAQGTYPEIHVGNVVNIQREVFPVIPIRMDYKFVRDFPNGLSGTALIAKEKEYSDVKKMLKKFPIDLNQLTDSLEESPDLGSVQDAFITFALNTVDDSEWNVRGLIATFKILLASSLYRSDAGLKHNVVTISEANFDYVIEFQYITHSEGYGYTPYIELRDDGRVTIPDSEIIDPFDGSSYGFRNWHDLVLVLKAHSPKGGGILDVIEVHGLTVRHYIHNEGNGLTDQFKPDEEGCLIPLLEEAVKDMPNRMRDDIVYGSVTLVTYAVQKTKVKWYQSTIFKALLFAASIAIAFVTPAGSALLAGLAAGGTAALTALITAVSVYLVVDYAAQWLVANLGELGIVLAIALAVATGNQFGSAITSFADAISAVFSATVRTVSMYQKSIMDELIDLNTAFEDTYKERMDDFDELRDMLDFGTEIDFTAIIHRTLPSVDSNESPSAFYNRTSTVIDLPTITNSMVTNYYAVQSALPQMDSYIGSSNNFNPIGEY